MCLPTVTITVISFKYINKIHKLQKFQTQLALYSANDDNN